MSKLAYLLCFILFAFITRQVEIHPSYAYLAGSGVTMIFCLYEVYKDDR